jgi:DNA polymerase III sliding clamp (beta) subunit (PCNA family)
MRATVLASDLSTALKQGVAPTGKTTLDVLTHVLVRTDGDGITIESTDLNIYVRDRIPARVEEEGEALLSAPMLSAAASVGGDIRLDHLGKVSRGRSHYKVPFREDVNDFPTQEDVAFTAVDVDPVALSGALRQVEYAPDDSDVRPFAKSVHVECGRVWATDGVLMGRVRFGYEGPTMSIPDSQLKRVIDVLGTGAKLQVANVQDGQAGSLRIDNGNLTVVVRLQHSGRLPDPEPLVPCPSDKHPEVIIERAGLVAALRRFLPFALRVNDKAGAFANVVLELQEGRFHMANTSGESNEDLTDLMKASKGGFREGFDMRRMLSLLQGIATDTVRLRPGMKGAAMLFQPGATEREQVAHVLMPVRL